jgi:hypothetical protein
MRTLLALVAVTLAIVLMRGEEPRVQRSATVILRSETGYYFFGLAIAASGPRLAVIDRSADKDFILRIERVDGGRVTTEARLPLGSAWSLPAVAMYGETVAVYRAAESEILVYRRLQGRWARTQSVALTKECNHIGIYGVHMGDGVMAIESSPNICVLEQSAAQRWSLTATLPRALARYAEVSRKRIIVASGREAEQLERRGDEWIKTKSFDVADAILSTAVSDRWLVLGSGNRLHVFDLDAGGRNTTVITPTRGHQLREVAVAATTLVAIDHEGMGLEWRFKRAWGRQTSFKLEDSSDVHPTTIGDMIWIGTPQFEGEGAGRVHGFDVR